MKVTVTNTGKVAGKETVQVYIRDLVASMSRPVLELKAFQQMTLQPGESKELTFKLSRESLSFYNAKGKLIFEPGDFEIGVGGSSDQLKRATVVMK